MLFVLGGLNGMVSLITMSEELSYVTTSFWSRDNVNQDIHLFHEQVFELTSGGSFLLASTWCLPPLHSRPEKIKWFPSFCYMDFFVCCLNACDSCIA